MADNIKTKAQVLEEIVARGKTTEEAEGVYASVLATKDQEELKSVYEFSLDAAGNDVDAAEAHFVSINLDAHLPPVGSAKISANAGVNDVQGTKMSSTGRTSKSEYSRPDVGGAAETAIKELLSKDGIDTRRQTTESSAITTLLIQKPNPSTYLMNGGKTMEVVPEIASDKLKLLEEQLVDSEENRKAFAVVKAAVENKTPLPVHINDEGNKRVVGCIVTVGKTPRTLNNQALKAFLFTEVLGCIPGKPGVVLNKWEDRKVASSGGVNKRSTTTVSMKWMGRDTAIKEGRVQFISVPCTPAEAKARGFESNMDKGVRLRVSESFKVSVYSRRSEKNIERTKRLTGKADVPKFVLKPEFKDYFQDTKRRDAVEMPSTPDELQAALDTLDTGLAAIAAGDFKPTASMLDASPALNDIVTKMRSAVMQSA